MGDEDVDHEYSVTHALFKTILASDA
jgi:hypothetical protein